ncbi:septum formation inhibitor Maf [Candidatus Roizmanbacteria bacterium]|nr:septum formation inhibitor Maf [Candidatus Roizmanbacteria bacterium]
MKQVILASSSPRRKKLLEQIGLTFHIIPSHYIEKRGSITDPHVLVKKYAEGKAKAVAKQFEEAIIIAADSVVYIENEILEKPVTEKRAKEMLKKLSGKPHEVITGFCILDTESKKRTTKSVTTNVLFKKLTNKEIDWYVSTGEPLDKAGAYAIQERGALFIKRIEGDFNNAVGLPLFSLFEELKKISSEIAL